MDRWTVLHIKQITNKNLRDSTQHFVITYKGKKSEEYMYITVSLCYTLESNTTLSIGNT